MYKQFYDYYVLHNGMIYSTKTNKLLKGNICNGYKVYCLSIGLSQKRYYAHRLVAQLFVDNDDPIHRNVVDHIDGNKLNNHYTNLQWLTNKDNLLKGNNRPVAQIDPKTRETINVFPNAMEAVKEVKNTSVVGIYSSCVGFDRLCGNYEWIYV